MSDRTITSEHLSGYREALRAAERSVSTLESYIRYAREFAIWLDQRELTHQAAADWKNTLTEGLLAASTINCKIAAVNGLLSYLGRPDCRLRPVRRQRQLFRDERRELTREEYGRLVRAARDEKDERMALVMETICATGIRVSELKFITLERVRMGTARISLKGKIRIIMVPSRLRSKLLRYASRQGIRGGELFLSDSGRSLSRKQIWAHMKALSLRAGVEPSKVYPHNLRHLFARAFYSECRDVVMLADVLGHSSLETTRIYLISTGAEHRAMLERLRLIS